MWDFEGFQRHGLHLVTPPFHRHGGEKITSKCFNFLASCSFKYIVPFELEEENDK